MTSPQTSVRVQETVEDLPPRSGPAKRVIVVGAGTAGLSAAYQLRRAGHSVTVLEARTRPGGRVFSMRQPFSDGLHAETGALFIPGDHKYLMKYINLTGLSEELDPILADQLGGFFHLEGQRLLDFEDGTGPKQWSMDGKITDSAWPGDVSERERKMSLEELLDTYLAGVDGGIGDVLDPGWPADHLKKHDDVTLVEYLQSQGASSSAAHLIRLGYFGGWGEIGLDLSALFTMQLYPDIRGLHGASNWSTIRGGNDRWHHRLAAMLRDEIHYGAEVVAISQDKEVHVTLRQHGAQSILDADHVICALPFSCLRQIAITPGLSATKKAAVEGLQSSSIGHYFIQCKNRIWRQGKRGLFSMGYTDLPLTWTIRDATFNQPGPRGLLDLFLMGKQVDDMEKLDEGERLEAALSVLEGIFPGISKEVEGAAFHSWTHEQYSRGDYAFYSPGQFNQIWPHVATPEGRIHFAGDQTSVISSWQEGAISSGHRAAREVHESL